MNQRKAIPANGTRPRPMLRRSEDASLSQSESAVSLSGIAVRINARAVVNSTANRTPASAAARGEFSGRRTAATASDMEVSFGRREGRVRSTVFARAHE